MLGIKYLAKKEGSWLHKQRTKKCRFFFGTAIQYYIFHEMTGLLVHISIMLLAGIATNFLNEEVAMKFFWWGGVFPALLLGLPYVIFGLFVNPIKFLIERGKRRKGMK